MPLTVMENFKVAIGPGWTAGRGTWSRTSSGLYASGTGTPTASEVVAYQAVRYIYGASDENAKYGDFQASIGLSPAPDGLTYPPLAFLFRDQGGAEYNDGYALAASFLNDGTLDALRVIRTSSGTFFNDQIAAWTGLGIGSFPYTIDLTAIGNRYYIAAEANPIGSFSDTYFPVGRCGFGSSAGAAGDFATYFASLYLSPYIQPIPNLRGRNDRLRA